MQDRPEIDGLRAVAVVPVILFHAGFSAFSGGYVASYAISHTSCLPLFGFKSFDGAYATSCAGFLVAAYDWAERDGITTVLIAGRFPLYLYGDRYDNTEGGVEPGGNFWVDREDRQSSKWDDPERHARVRAAYEDAIVRLSKRFKVVLIYPIPEAGCDVPNRGLRHAFLDGPSTTLTTSYLAYENRTGEVNALFDALVASSDKIFAARVYEALCKDSTGRCLNVDAGGVYDIDDDHLSNAGTRLVAPLIVDATQKALAH